MRLIEIRRKLNKKFAYWKSLEDMKRFVSDNRINFFIGTGFALPLLKPQRNIDTTLNAISIANPLYDTLKAYLLWNFFIKSICPLLQLDLNTAPQKRFTYNIKSILLNENIPILTKQINVFTTNFDPLLEMGFNRRDGVKYNDGMDGKTVQVLSVDNYMQLKTEQIVYYDEHDKADRSMEIPEFTDNPTINIFKMHGSLTWKRNPHNNNIEFVDYPKIIFDFNNKYRDVFDKEITNAINDLTDFEYSEKKIMKNIDRIFYNHKNLKLEKHITKFFEDFYNTFMIVDPIERTFVAEEIEVYYNRLLKVLISELSKDKALLIVFGSQFKDQHIRKAVREALKTGLALYIFCSEQSEVELFQNYFNENNDNVYIISPYKTNYTLNDFNDLLEYINSGVED